MIMSMTDNQPSVVDSDEFTVRRTVTIEAPIEKVWAAVTEPEHISRWFGQAAAFDGMAVGARGTLTWDDYGTIPVLIEELDPPRAVAYRWSNEVGEATDPERVDPAHSTVFRFTLEAVDGGTRLTVVESGFDTLSTPAASMESNRSGWDAELDELVAYLEGES
jgi:uncharacterized protein YndB with AHSA1/START domain